MSPPANRTPPALYALAIGAFGIGTTEFMPMGLLQQIAGGLHVDIARAGLLVSAYALGVFIGAPLLTLATRRLPRKAVLLGLGLLVAQPLPMVLFIGLLGLATFATVAPLQLWVLRKAAAAPSLASSLNIGAFNLANALGAWLGSATLARGHGLAALPWAAALVAATGIAIALLAVRGERASRRAAVAACPQT